MPRRPFVAANWKMRRTGEAVLPDAEDPSGS
jgi:hypothetical protein